MTVVDLNEHKNKDNFSDVPDPVVESKDVDLRVLHPVITEAKAAQIGQKRPSTEAPEGKNKKSKTVFDRYLRLFFSSPDLVNKY